MTIEKLTKKSNITTQASESNLSPRYPHPNLYYQPFTKKAFMQFDWFTTLVAIISVIPFICICELHAEKLVELQHILFNIETIKFHISLPPKADLE